MHKQNPASPQETRFLLLGGLGFQFEDSLALMVTAATNSRPSLGELRF